VRCLFVLIRIHTWPIFFLFVRIQILLLLIYVMKNVCLNQTLFLIFKTYFWPRVECELEIYKVKTLIFLFILVLFSFFIYFFLSFFLSFCFAVFLLFRSQSTAKKRKTNGSLVQINIAVVSCRGWNFHGVVHIVTAQKVVLLSAKTKTLRNTPPSTKTMIFFNRSECRVTISMYKYRTRPFLLQVR